MVRSQGSVSLRIARVIQDNRHGDQIAAGLLAGRRDLVTMSTGVRGAVKGERDPTASGSCNMQIRHVQGLLRQTFRTLRRKDDVSVPKND